MTATNLSDSAARVTFVTAHRLRAETAAWSASRLLSAAGHPGYGEEFAARVIHAYAATGRPVHALISELVGTE